MTLTTKPSLCPESFQLYLGLKFTKESDDTCLFLNIIKTTVLKSSWVNSTKRYTVFSNILYDKFSVMYFFIYLDCFGRYCNIKKVISKYVY